MQRAQREANDLVNLTCVCTVISKPCSGISMFAGSKYRVRVMRISEGWRSSKPHNKSLTLQTSWVGDEGVASAHRQLTLTTTMVRKGCNKWLAPGASRSEMEVVV